MTTVMRGAPFSGYVFMKVLTRKVILVLGKRYRKAEQPTKVGSERADTGGCAIKHLCHLPPAGFKQQIQERVRLVTSLGGAQERVAHPHTCCVTVWLTPTLVCLGVQKASVCAET